MSAYQREESLVASGYSHVEVFRVAHLGELDVLGHALGSNRATKVRVDVLLRHLIEYEVHASQIAIMIQIRYFFFNEILVVVSSDLF